MLGKILYNNLYTYTSNVYIINNVKIYSIHMCVKKKNCTFRIDFSIYYSVFLRMNNVLYLNWFKLVKCNLCEIFILSVLLIF